MALSNFNGILLSDLSAFDGISSISAINGIAATLGTDATAPTLSSATVAANGTTLTLVFSEAVSQGAGYADTDLNVDASTTGADLGLTYVSGDGTNTWVYTIASTIQSGETVDLDFNGDANSIEDGAGNDLAAIVSGAVTNNSTQAGAWTPTDEASLVRWIASDNLGGSLNNDDPISTATDASGSANNLTQTGTARPTFKTNIVGSLPAMLFASGSSQYLAGSAVAGTSKTWGIAFRAIAATTTVLTTKSGIANYFNFAGAGYTSEFLAARIDNYPASVPTTGDVVLMGVSSSSTFELYLNGTTGEGAQTANFNAGDVLYLGANGTLATFHNSYIFEYVEFNEAFDSTKRGNLYTYLTRWQ